MRKGCPALIGELKKIPGIQQVTLTTNGQQLEKFLPELEAAGVDGINISMDSLRPDRFRQTWKHCLRPGTGTALYLRQPL